MFLIDKSIPQIFTTKSIVFVEFAASKAIGGLRTQKQLLEKSLLDEGQYVLSESLLTGIFSQVGFAIRHRFPSDTGYILFNAGTWENYTIIFLLLALGKRIYLLPSYHPPQHVKHKIKAVLSLVVLNIAGLLGLTLVVNTLYEKSFFPMCKAIVHPFLPPLSPQQSDINRIYDFVFLGRPTKQKGFFKFIKIAQILPEKSFLAVTPSPIKTRYPLPANITVRIAPDNTTVSTLLQESRVLLLPSDYESLGYAQLEAITHGCCVPILGKWPFWDCITDNIPSLNLYASLNHFFTSRRAGSSFITHLCELLADYSAVNALTYTCLARASAENRAHDSYA
jgi:glycosyltransferase involved in cell wall biosynthesis